MRDSKGESVQSIVDKLDPTQKEIVKRLQRVVRASVPKAEEVAKWGNVTYTLNGKNLICLMIYRDHVNYGFFMGAKLKSKRLEGTGKGLRYAKVYAPAEVDEKEFSKLAKDAASLVQAIPK